MLENNSLKLSFRNSIRIYSKNKIKVIYYLVLCISVSIIILISLFILYLFLGGYIIIKLGDNNPYIVTFVITYLIFFIINYVFISIIALPMFMSFLTELYYKFKNYSSNERKNFKINYNSNNVLVFIKKFKYLFNIAVVLIFTLNVIFTTKSLLLNQSIKKDISITAHRGSSSKAPENSISSILQAIMDGADYTEIDVMTTKDNQVVLFHDLNLYKVNGSIRAIKDITIDELKDIDNGSYFSPKFKGEKIPMLEEALKIAKDKIKINIDMKILSENDNLPVEVAKLIKKYDMEKDVIVSSSNYSAIQKVKAYCPDVKIGYIINAAFGNFSVLDVDFLSVEYQMLTPNLVYTMHALNKEVHVWTINSKEQISNAIKLRVDNIITDSVDTVKSVINNSNIYEKNCLIWFYDSILSIIKYINI